MQRELIPLLCTFCLCGADSGPTYLAMFGFSLALEAAKQLDSADQRRLLERRPRALSSKIKDEKE